jgi:DNA-damage-inducible protein J
MSKKSVSFRIDSDLKDQADELFARLGLNITTAFNIFLRQSVREGRIPFDIALKTPNTETIAAMREVEQLAKDPNTKSYLTAEEALRDLKS